MTDANEIFSDLNKQQLQAVNCSLGNKLILAGAGSGKTRVLTCRVAELINTFDVRPSDILALTFTNKASNEMKQRLEKLLKISSYGLWFGTFHGICRRLLKIHWKEAGISEYFTILDSQDQLRIIKRVMKSKNLDDNLYDPKALQSFINSQKDKGKRHKDVNNDDDKYIEIYKEYDDACRQTNSVDFADLILLTYEMFKNNPQILNYYNKRFQNIMVDEFQDTNTLQFNLLKLLNGNTGSLYAVGDDDQSIYGWRGARSRNIQFFKDEFKNVEIFKLEQNYRSTNKILSVANNLISNNKERLGKNLWTDSAGGDPVYLYEAYNGDDESSFIAQKIQELVLHGHKRSEIALLYRSNFLSRRLEEELNSRSIPYKIYGGFRFFERSEVKDVIAYLRIAVNTSDDSAFERTVNNPPRGLGEKTIQVIREYAKNNSLSMWDTINQIEKTGISGARAINSFASYANIIRELIEKLNDLDLKSLIEKVINLSTLNQYYELKKNEESLSKQENLEELLSTAERFYQNNMDSENILGDFLDNASLEAGDLQSNPHDDPVQLMTIHSAKGLEFPVVFLTGMDEGIFPNENRNLKKGFLEEERRLCYVAITRAMKTLYITHANMRYMHGNNNFLIPSRFINEIDDDLLESIKSNNKSLSNKYNSFSQKKKDFDNYSQDSDIENYSQEENTYIKIGQRVSHMKFGDGVVLSYTGKSDDLKLHINFESYGKKWLVLSYAQLDFLK
ncbi:MAG: DNA helicase-2/ATP-dependent DNA helicase PcrA [Gammaproteobacteria bacterium]|mgnify:FL=1|jgi:DNA helicase-2/ATP-dependent DNA helicase PcrA